MVPVELKRKLPKNRVLERCACLETDILHNLAVKWTSKLNRYAQKEGIELQKMILGMEIILHNIPKIVLMIVVSLILGIFQQTFVTWLSFVCIRRYASGLHASNSTTCTVMTLLMFVAMPYVMQNITIGAITFILIFAIVGLGLYIYAPADTKARPILGKKKRGRLKRSAVIANFVMLAVTLIFLNEVFYVLVAMGAVYAVVVVLPLTYKILRRSIKNYEQYE